MGENPTKSLFLVAGGAAKKRSIFQKKFWKTIPNSVVPFPRHERAPSTGKLCFPPGPGISLSAKGPKMGQETTSLHVQLGPNTQS